MDKPIFDFKKKCFNNYRHSYLLNKVLIYIGIKSNLINSNKKGLIAEASRFYCKLLIKSHMLNEA